MGERCINWSAARPTAAAHGALEAHLQRGVRLLPTGDRAQLSGDRAQ
jgi:hypothetical protein